MALYLLYCYLSSALVVALISLTSTLLDFNAMYVDFPTLVSDTLGHGLKYGLVLFLLTLPVTLALRSRLIKKTNTKKSFLLFCVLLVSGIIGAVAGWMLGMTYVTLRESEYSQGGDPFAGIIVSMIGALVGFVVFVVLSRWLYRYIYKV